MKKNKKFPKTFETEDDFKKYLKDNKDYILNILSDDVFYYKDERFICDSTMIIFCVRYAVGRKTGAVNTVVDWILKEWERINPNDQTVIVKEIIEFEKNYGNLGFEWNREQWYRIINKNLFGLIDETNN